MDVELAGELLQLSSLRPFAKHDELRVRNLPQRPDRHVDALLRLEPADAEQQAGVGRHWVRRILSPGLR